MRLLLLLLLLLLFKFHIAPNHFIWFYNIFVHVPRSYLSRWKNLVPGLTLFLAYSLAVSV